ncbi:MAG: hypothetical protein ACFFG0_02480 [Candidatus Thorarchaeota archaeon]
MKKIKKVLVYVLIFLICMILSFAGGYTYHVFNGEKPKPEIVYKEKVKYKIITRDYSKIPSSVKDNELLHYDTDPFKLDIEPFNGDKTNYRITGQLYKRKASRDVKIECSGNSNWKFYVGAAIIGTAVGYGIYKAIKK